MKLNVTNFKIVLARRKMNPRDLAGVSGISYNTISSLIKNTGRRNPSLKTLGRLAEALEVDVTDLIEN
jgi:DNA-binding Xre family transcriptional regulator